MLLVAVQLVYPSECLILARPCPASLQVGSYPREHGPRCEVMDGVCHASTPAGGRTNLRNLVGKQAGNRAA